MTMHWIIRPVESQDNGPLEAMIKAVLIEYGCVGEGYAFSDPELACLYETYSQPGSAYWVLADSETDRIMGGGGFARLAGTMPKEGICELQKLYFSPEARGHGFGKKFMTLCLEGATHAGYRLMYLETVPQMKEAIGLYEKFGFTHIPGPMGDTGHSKCDVTMTRPLSLPLASPAPLSFP